jgi:hypothetical protein
MWRRTFGMTKVKTMTWRRMIGARSGTRRRTILRTRMSRTMIPMVPVPMVVVQVVVRKVVVLLVVVGVREVVPMVVVGAVRVRQGVVDRPVVTVVGQGAVVGEVEVAEDSIRRSISASASSTSAHGTKPKSLSATRGTQRSCRS